MNNETIQFADHQVGIAKCTERLKEMMERTKEIIRKIIINYTKHKKAFIN